MFGSGRSLNAILAIRGSSARRIARANRVSEYGRSSEAIFSFKTGAPLLRKGYAKVKSR